MRILAFAAVMVPIATAFAADPKPAAGLLNLKSGVVQLTERENLLDEPFVSFAADEFLILQMDGPLTREKHAALSTSGLVLGEYLPEHCYIVAAANVDFARLRSLRFVLWLGRFDPGWRLDPELGIRPLSSDFRAQLRAQGWAQVVVTVFAATPARSAIDAIEAHGGITLHQSIVGDNALIDALIPLDSATAIAATESIQFIEEAPDGAPRNHSNRWIVQGNQLDQTPVWNRGLHGEGQVAGIIDTTVYDPHCMFTDTVPPGDPGHRKIIGWRNAGAGQPHGTHVAGTLVGDAPPYGEYSINDGLAFAAKMSFSNTTHLFSNPSTLYQRLVDAHNDGARVHNNSWGDDNTRNYTTWCRQFDQYSYDFEDGLAVVAVSYTAVVTTPENANSVLAVAACGDAPNQGNHTTGGTGPTLDGRRKPEVFAPGQSTTSAISFTACGYGQSSGTSMACPAVSAAGVLARQYFVEGYYPTGAPRGGDARTPSGALLRALLVNSADDMPGVAGYPSNLEGWGRVALDNALHFQFDPEELLIQDVRNAEGLSTGETAGITFEVFSGQLPLRITMSYTQPPAAIKAADPVVNTWDVEVVGPDGALYRGNHFLGGESAADGIADGRNNVERVVRTAPLPGLYTATIRAAAVNAGEGIGRQGFAVVVNADLAESCPAPPVGDFDGDCRVTLQDLATMLATFGVCTGQPGFNALADFNASGCVDLSDLAALLANFGM